MRSYWKNFNRNIGFEVDIKCGIKIEFILRILIFELNEETWEFPCERPLNWRRLTTSIQNYTKGLSSASSLYQTGQSHLPDFWGPFLITTSVSRSKGICDLYGCWFSNKTIERCSTLIMTPINKRLGGCMWMGTQWLINEYAIHPTFSLFLISKLPEYIRFIWIFSNHNTVLSQFQLKMKEYVSILCFSRSEGLRICDFGWKSFSDQVENSVFLVSKWPVLWLWNGKCKKYPLKLTVFQSTMSNFEQIENQ